MKSPPASFYAVSRIDQGVPDAEFSKLRRVLSELSEPLERSERPEAEQCQDVQRSGAKIAKSTANRDDSIPGISGTCCMNLWTLMYLMTLVISSIL